MKKSIAQVRSLHRVQSRRWSHHAFQAVLVLGVVWLLGMIVWLEIQRPQMAWAGTQGSENTKDQGEDPCPCPPDASASPSSSGSGTPTTTTNPIEVMTGKVLESEVDLRLPSMVPGFSWMHKRDYDSRFDGIASPDQQGEKWFAGRVDMFIEQVGDDIEIFFSASSKRVFTWDAGSSSFLAPSDFNATLTETTGYTDVNDYDNDGDDTETFTIYELVNLDTDRVHIFLGIDGNITSGAQRRLVEETTVALKNDDAVGNLYTYGTNHQITSITTADGTAVVYDYINGGADDGRIDSIEIRPDGTNADQKVEYTYYDEVTSPSTDIGSTGDLVQVKASRLASDGTSWTERYTQYRYYRDTDSDGKAHQLKAVLESDAIQRVNDAGDAAVDTPEEMMTKADSYSVNSSDDLSKYASRSFTYYTSDLDTTTGTVTTSWGSENLDGRYGGTNFDEDPGTGVGFAKSETINGDCSSCGGSSSQGVTKQYYYMDLNGGPDTVTDLDEVARIVIEDTLVDLNGDGDFVDTNEQLYRTVWGLNTDGKALRTAMLPDADPATTSGYDVWCGSTVIGNSGNSTDRITERRMASAHASIDSDTELKMFLDPTTATNDADTLATSGGVVVVYEYNSDGRPTGTRIKEGSGGTAYYVDATDWGAGDDDEPTDRPLAMYAYPTQTTTRTAGNKTTIEYDFHNTDDTVLKQARIKPPLVDTDQNGSNVQTTITQYFDELGRLRWSQDGEGYIDYCSYHPVTGQKAYMAYDVDPASLPTSADSNSTKWITSSTAGASTNKPTRSGSLSSVIAMVSYTEFDDQGRPIKTVGETPSTSDEDDVTHIVYEDTRTLVFPQWDSSSNQPAFPIVVNEDNGAGVMQKSYRVDPARTAQTGGVPTGLSAGTDQSHYVSLMTYQYDAITGRSTGGRRYHDIPSSGDGTLSTNYDATIVQYDAIGRPETTIHTVSGTTAGSSSSVEQVMQYVYENAFLSRAVETKMGVSSGSHAMGSSYDTLPTLTTVSKTTYDSGGVGDGHLTQALSFHGSGANDWTGANIHRDYRGLLRGVETIYYNSGETAIGPFSVQDLRWDGRVTHSAVYDANPTWATVLGDDDYANTITTDRRTLSETLYDDLGRPYRSKSYTVAESDGSKGSRFESDLFYDESSRLVAVAPAYKAATEYAYDGLGRRYQSRSVAKLEGEAGSYYSSGDFNYQSPTPDPDFSSMTGGDDCVYTIGHTEFTDNTSSGKETGLPTRSYRVDMAPFIENNQSATTGVDFTNNDDYVVTYAYSYYDDARRPVAAINHGSGTDGSGNNGWVYGAEPAYDFTDIPQFTDDGTGSSPDVEGLKAILATYAYDADTGRRSLVTTATGSADPLVQVATKTFYDDLGRATSVAGNYTNFDPANLSTIGGGTNDVEDRVTAIAYNGLSNTTSQTAYNGSSADDQVTEYLYTDAVSASRNTLIKYPDGNTTTNGDNITLTYHVDGSIDTRRDQRGVVTTYAYTDRRQLDYIAATTIPGGGAVDDAIKAIGYTYDDLARVEKVTSYDSADKTGNIVNEVAYEFNDLGQVTDSYQDHDGAATSADPTVSYGYDLSAPSSVYNDGARLSSMTYPDGRVLSFGYLSVRTDAIYERMNRVYQISESGSRLIATTSSPRGLVSSRRYDKVSVNGGTDIIRRPWLDTTDDGYDRFGRVVQSRYTQGGSTLAELDYGYDAGSNRVYREDALAAAQTTPQDLDELYVQDDLSRLNGFQLGDVDTSTLSISAADRDFTQDWTLDQLGNWQAFDEDDDGDETYDLEQTRTANDANEIGTIAATTGTNWVDPTYDAAGNMTKRPDPADPGDANDAHDITYDAWNRVVKIEDSSATIATYEYDGLNRRIQKTVGSDTYDYYHSESWRVLEVRQNGGANPLEQFVYDTNYVDALVMRWYDGDTDGIYDGEGGSDATDDDDGEQYYLYDASYNVIALLDKAGTALERYRYTPYGDRIVLDADFTADSDNTTDYGQHRGFQGLLLDEESGLYENRARLLDPLTGRFVQRDPLGYPDGMNTYAAYHVLWGGVDPWGLDSEGHYSRNINGQQTPASYARREMELFHNSDSWVEISRRSLRGNSGSPPVYFTLDGKLSGESGTYTCPKEPGIGDYSSIEPQPVTEEELAYRRFQESTNQFLLDTQVPVFGNVMASAILWGSDSPEVQGMAEGFAVNALTDAATAAVSWGATRTPGYRPKFPAADTGASAGKRNYGPGAAHADDPAFNIRNASEIYTPITPGTKAWDDMVDAIAGLGKGKHNCRVRSASEAKQLLEEARGKMNRYKQYTRDGRGPNRNYEKGYEVHNDQNLQETAVGNDLQHLKWFDGKSSGHIFYDGTN